VDSLRSVLLVASPFAKRGFVDHTLYTTSGVLRTIELILGIPPMSQYDAAATPLVGAFNPIPDLSFFRRRAARIPLDEKNLPSAPGAAASLAMDFSEADRTPEVLLNDIWRSVKGADSPMPPLVIWYLIDEYPTTEYPDHPNSTSRLFGVSSRPECLLWRRTDPSVHAT
jgi:hypothetical protein